MYGHPNAVFRQHPDGHSFFVNFDIFKWLNLAYFWVCLHQTWGFSKAWASLYDFVDQYLPIPLFTNSYLVFMV